MNIFTKILIIFCIVCIVAGVGTVTYVVSTNNTAVKLEQSVKSQYAQNQNNYDNYFKKLKEVAQVPEMYTTDLKQVYESVITGRYRKDGSKAVVQFIQEHNPNVDSSLYKQIQQVIESGRNDFEMNQKMLLDKKRVYEVFLESIPSGLIANFMGFPKINLDEYKIVTSEETDAAFKTGESEPIKLR